MKTKFAFRAILLFFVVSSFGCGVRQTMFGGKPLGYDSKEFGGPPPAWLKFSEADAKFMAGFSKKKITPESVQWLGGYLPGRLGLFIQADLWSKCSVLEDKNKNALAVVSLDLIGLLPTDVDGIKERIAMFFDGEVLLHTTHTHSAPDTYGIWGFGLGSMPLFSGRDEKYVLFLKKQIAACLQEAIVSKAPAMLTFSAGSLDGITRGPRGMDPDTSVNIMRIVSKDKSVILVNYAIHPDMFYTNYVSSDLLYYTYEFLEKETGSEVMYINGAIGGVQPIRKSKYPNRWERAREIGVAIGEEVLRLIEKEEISKKQDIFFRKKRLFLSVENSGFVWAARLGLMPEQRNPEGKVSVDVHYLTIGDATLITFPGEAFPNVAAALKGWYVPGAYKFIFGLTNGEIGYLLFSPDFKSGRYPYHSRVSLSSLAGDEVFEALRELIETR